MEQQMWKLGEGTCHLVWAAQRIPDVLSALKEVVYNSIDANASAIVVAIGTDNVSFSVNDNGHGIRGLDLCALVCNVTATSKNDTMNAHGYKYRGWRGESLLCISKLSRITIESRKDSSWNTYRKIIHNGKPEFQGRVSSKKCIPGTVVTVQNLFGNVPARQRQLLDNVLVRAKFIASVRLFCLRAGLIHGRIAFDVIDKQGHTSVLRLPVLSDARQQLASLVGAACPSYNALAFASTPSAVGNSSFHIDGVMSAKTTTFLPWSTVNVTRAMQSYQCISFNNLWIDGFYAHCMGLLRQHILQHRTAIPVIIANVQCSLDEFTLVNEPDTRVVLFRQPAAFDEFFRAFLELVLPLPSNSCDDENGVDSDHQEFEWTSGSCRRTDQAGQFGDTFHAEREQLAGKAKSIHSNTAFDEFSNAIWTSMPNRVTSRTAPLPLMDSNTSCISAPASSSKYFRCKLSNRKQWDDQRVSKTGQPNMHPSCWMKQHLSVLVQNARSCQSMAIQLPSSMLQHLRVLRQVDNKFILVQSNTPPLLLCIDQHAADERVKLEALENSLLHDTFPTRTLDDVQPLHLNDAEKNVVRRHWELIHRWGFQIEVADVDRWVLVSVPVVDHREAACDDFFEYICLLATLSAQPPTIRPPVVTRFMNSRACRSAIMFGDPLTREQCQKLIRQLSECRLPFQCAHGRPSIAPLVQLPPSA
ncbi:hypothetical protein H310_06080 [Aphanomyces invadans]|uniref:MutL C-terminal dimerisation domain-containing protein n=1 Tax=Aphanomyces invadans TaxID=157072 RepID=A0A024U840_9STRA|nr:hypothetical protein H310_06080 [Aphanomyces invadans]ETW02611.1 hypothetical protein H310_06080 [Aphanomyces invadans]|eukprot:XP_008869216.1 hypothetical protein H310_06080 [Aphanomyces invadans]